MLLHLNIYHTNINHDVFLEMDANVIVQVTGNTVEIQP